MEPWQSDPQVIPQAPPVAGGEPWKNDPVVQPPKMPDMSGVQKQAQANLAANDNKTKSDGAIVPPQTPEQRLDTASGFSVSAALNGGDVALPAAVRGNLVDAYSGGVADDLSDYMQSALHGLTPIVAGIINPVGTAKNYLNSVGDTVVGGGERAVGTLAYPALSEESKQKLIDSGKLGEVPTLTGNEGHDMLAKGLTRANALLSPGIGAAYTLAAAPVAPLISPLIQGLPEAGKNAGLSEDNASLLSAAAEFGMNLLGGFHGAGELSAARTARINGPMPAPGTGPWDNVPGHETMRGIVGQVIGKAPETVTSSDIDNTIHAGFKGKAPTAQDFKAVANVSGADVDTLHTIYKDTGIKPDQVFEDANRSPDIASDVAAGKVPEAYEHLVEPKTPLPTDTAEKLSVVRSDTGKTFNVVDAEGDHVQGGFDSAEEAQHHIEDLRYEAQERAAIEDEGKEAPKTEKTPAGEQTVIPGAERISDKELALREMDKPLQSPAEQKPANEGLFDVAGRSQTDLFDAANRPTKPKYIPPSEIGKPTSLASFIRNNGGIKDTGGDLKAMGADSLIKSKGKTFDEMGEAAQQAGYFKDSPSINDFKDTLGKTNNGDTHFRDADIDRVLKAKEAKAARENLDPAKIEHAAHEAGIDTEPVKGETAKQRATRLLNAVKEFYKNQEGSAAMDAYRKAVGATITAAEKFAGKLTGNLFKRLGDAYIKTFQPELAGDKALRADAYLAKFKAAGQEAENSFYRQFNKEIAGWDKKSTDERMQWIDDHETGRWNEHDDPDHAAFQTLLDSTFKEEKKAIGADPEKGYKENYLPLQFADPEGVKKFFTSDPAMMRKYGADWFTKARSFNLIQDAVRAGFKLKTDNPARMMVARLLAGDSMIRTMDLLHDMESNGLAKPVRAFSVDKRIAKTQQAIADVKEKYKKELADIDKQASLTDKDGEPIGEPISKKMQNVQQRIEKLSARLEDFNKEKAENKLTPDQMKELKGNGFRVIGPDSKVWNIHNEIGPLWKNAMESKGLWEKEGILGDAYRGYTGTKAIWTAAKLGLSLFHPVHVAMIDLASHIAAGAEHLINGGKFSDFALTDNFKNLMRDESTAVNEHPAVRAWNTAPEARTPEQTQMVQTMVEGGFKPTMSARDTIHFRENFDKAINGVGLNNLRLIGTALQLPGKAMSPFFEHWIPGLKSEIYLRRAAEAMQRDPSLAQNAGRRSEVLREIAKGTDRTYGEMNNEVQFWDKTIRDSFNAAFISGGWKLAQIYNAKGLLQPLKIATKFAKTGEFNKADITFNMLHAYTYTALTLATGAAINYMLGNPIGTAKDTVWDMVKNLVAPQTGEKNPDGTPIRLNQPAFAKEAYSLAHDINTKGLISGAGSFLYHQTLFPGIADTLNNRDFTGRQLISDPTDLHQWMNAGWESVSPISLSTQEKAEQKHSEVGKVAGMLGFPMGGAYLNQTPFEQKVLYTYDQQNPPKGDVYSQKLKADLKSAIAGGDEKKVDAVKQRMKEEGMTAEDISHAEKPYTKKFVDTAWKKLTVQDQKRLIESASDEEKQKFKLKSQ